MSKYDIRQIFAEIELKLIASMKRNLAAHEDEEKKYGFRWAQWQARKLASLKEYQRRNRQIVEEAMPNVEDGLLRTLRGSFRRGAKSVGDAAKRVWHRFGFGRREDTPRPIPGTPTPELEPPAGAMPPPDRHEAIMDDDHFFKANRRRLDALTDAAKGEMRKAGQGMLRTMDDVYRQTIYKAQVYHNSGAGSLGQAIDMATQDFLDRGITSITYADGRRVNVASYAEMTLRTASQRAIFAGEGAVRQEIGVKTVVVSNHSNCSKLCLPWQGKVYIDDVYSGGKAGDGPYPLLSTAMRGGLFHPNCRHNMATYFPGSSRMPEPVDDARALANYQAEQKQRYYERQIRKWKRRQAGAVDPDNEKAAKAKVKEWQGRMREHLAENDFLRRDSKREKVKI